MGMDSIRLNREGRAPLEADLAMLNNAKRGDFIRLIAWQHRGIGDAFFNSQVMADLKNSEQNMLYLTQGGIGMGDRDYYLENDANTLKVYQDALRRSRV